MPPAHNNTPKDQEISLEQLKLLGELLAPAFAQAIQPQLDGLRKDLNSSLVNYQQEVENQIQQSATESRGHIARLEKRTRSLEQYRWWLGGAVAVLLTLVEVATHWHH